MLDQRLAAAGIKSKSDELYIGMTPKALIDAMRKTLEDAKRGKFQGGALSTVAGAGVCVGASPPSRSGKRGRFMVTTVVPLGSPCRL